MQIRIEFVYSDETRVLEKDSSVLTFNYGIATKYKQLHLVNEKPEEGPILEGYIDDKKRLAEIRVICNGVLMKRTQLASLERATYRCNANELGELREYIEVQYQV